MAAILETISVRNQTIRNRVVLPPIVVFWANQDGTVSDQQVAHYRRRAAGGCGLIVVEATCVTPEGRLSNRQLGIWDEKKIEGLSRIAKACNDLGAKTLIQIHHGGMLAAKEVSQDKISASDYQDEKRSARAMTVDEIAAVRDAFIAGAKRAWKAGFNGVELHGAHGYLLSQFASPRVNKREDGYGGDTDGRLRLAGEIIRGIRAEVPDNNFIVTCRMGFNEPTLHEGLKIAKKLEDFGVDMLHVSSGFGGNGEPEVPESFQGSWISWGGSEIRKSVQVPVIVVSGIRTPAQAEWLLDGHADMVALARGLLVDPDWPLKAKTGEEIITCAECKPNCKWFSDGKSCPRYNPEWEDTATT